MSVVLSNEKLSSSSAGCQALADKNMNYDVYTCEQHFWMGLTAYKLFKHIHVSYTHDPNKITYLCELVCSYCSRVLLRVQEHGNVHGLMIFMQLHVSTYHINKPVQYIIVYNIFLNAQRFCVVSGNKDCRL